MCIVSMEIHLIRVYNKINKSNRATTTQTNERQVHNMSKHTITMKEIQNMINNGITTFSKKDDSPRGCKTVAATEIQIGDKVVIDNYFTLITE